MREQLHILIPLDGSKLAERAVAYVPAFMAMGVAKVLLTGVVEEEGHHGPLQEEDIERERNLLATYLEQVAEELRLSTTLEVEAKAIRGRPAADHPERGRSVPAGHRAAFDARRFRRDPLASRKRGRQGHTRCFMACARHRSRRCEWGGGAGGEDHASVPDPPGAARRVGTGRAGDPCRHADRRGLGCDDASRDCGVAGRPGGGHGMGG